MGVDDLTPSKSRLLNRRPPEELAHLYEGAVRVIEQMHAEGQLKPVADWINERGEPRASWPDDDILGCYMDMLGLNGRAITERSPLEQARIRAARRQAHAAHG